MVLIAAVDDTDRASTVLREAESLASAFDELIHIVHVLSISEFVSLERTSMNKIDQILDMDEVRMVAEDITNEIITETHLNVEFETVGLVGDPAPRIVEYATKTDARYVIVSGRKRSPTGKVIFGSTSQTILMNADCPVVSAIQ